MYVFIGEKNVLTYILIIKQNYFDSKNNYAYFWPPQYIHKHAFKHLSMFNSTDVLYSSYILNIHSSYLFLFLFSIFTRYVVNFCLIKHMRMLLSSITIGKNRRVV